MFLIIRRPPTISIWLDKKSVVSLVGWVGVYKASVGGFHPWLTLETQGCHLSMLHRVGKKPPFLFPWVECIRKWRSFQRMARLTSKNQTNVSRMLLSRPRHSALNVCLLYYYLLSFQIKINKKTNIHDWGNDVSITFSRS